MHRMQPAIVAAALFLATPSFAQEKTADEGFTPLFNGRDFAGWVITAGPPDAALAWSVKEGGIIDVTGKQLGSWLRTEKTYRDFILRLEYKIAHRENSGIFIRSLEAGNPAYSGMEIQVYGDDPGRPPGIHSNGALYASVAPTTSPAKNGQWNKIEIELRGTRLVERQNGVKVLDVRLDDPAVNGRIADYNRQLAESQKNLPPTAKKKPPIPLLTGRVGEGYIGLQNHGSPVQFRHIRIKVLE